MLTLMMRDDIEEYLQLALTSVLTEEGMGPTAIFCDIIRLHVSFGPLTVLAE